MIINGTELELDLLDIETAAKYEAAVAVCKDAAAPKINEAETLVDTIKASGNAAYGLIDGIWGAGTARRILGETYHMQKCLDAINAIFDEEYRQAGELRQWTEKFKKARSQ